MDAAESTDEALADYLHNVGAVNTNSESGEEVQPHVTFAIALARSSHLQLCCSVATCCDVCHKSRDQLNKTRSGCCTGHRNRIQRDGPFYSGPYR